MIAMQMLVRVEFNHATNVHFQARPPLFLDHGAPQ
jgi:hypothetical protein